MEIQDILKNHANPRAIKIDPNNVQVKNLLEMTKKLQQESLARKNVDWQKLENTVITI